MIRKLLQKLIIKNMPIPNIPMKMKTKIINNGDFKVYYTQTYLMIVMNNPLIQYLHVHKTRILVINLKAKNNIWRLTNHNPKNQSVYNKIEIESS